MRALVTETSVRVVRGTDDATAGLTRVVRGSYCTGKSFRKTAAGYQNFVDASGREMGNAGCQTRAQSRVYSASTLNMKGCSPSLFTPGTVR
jgi:hypothetical protein